MGLGSSWYWPRTDWFGSWSFLGWPVQLTKSRYHWLGSQFKQFKTKLFVICSLKPPNSRTNHRLELGILVKFSSHFYNHLHKGQGIIDQSTSLSRAWDLYWLRCLTLCPFGRYHPLSKLPYLYSEYYSVFQLFLLPHPSYF